MLSLTIFMMRGTTVLIGFFPTLSQIGWWAPVLLVTLRAIQGFAVSGEWDGLNAGIWLHIPHYSTDW